MTDLELQELAKGAKALTEQERIGLRERIPSGSLKSREGFIEGVRAARALLNGAGDGLAGLEAQAARDLLDYRRATEELDALDTPEAREELERQVEDLLSGKAKGVPMDEVIRQMEEIVRASAGPGQERRAG